MQAKLWFHILDVSSEGSIDECEFLSFVLVASCPFARTAAPKTPPVPVFPRVGTFAFLGVFMRLGPIATLDSHVPLRRRARIFFQSLFQRERPLVTCANPTIVSPELDQSYHVNG